MKNLLLLCLQVALFLIVFAIGSLFPPFNIAHVLTVTSRATHLFVADGLLLMSVLYILLLVIEALTKRLRGAGPWTTLALVLATVTGLLMKFGFITHEL